MKQISRFLVLSFFLGIPCFANTRYHFKIHEWEADQDPVLAALHAVLPPAQRLGSREAVALIVENLSLPGVLCFVLHDFISDFLQDAEAAPWVSRVREVAANVPGVWPDYPQLHQLLTTYLETLYGSDSSRFSYILSILLADLQDVRLRIWAPLDPLHLRLSGEFNDPSRPALDLQVARHPALSSHFVHSLQVVQTVGTGPVDPVADLFQSFYYLEDPVPYHEEVGKKLLALSVQFMQQLEITSQESRTRLWPEIPHVEFPRGASLREAEVLVETQKRELLRLTVRQKSQRQASPSPGFDKAEAQFRRLKAELDVWKRIHAVEDRALRAFEEGFDRAMVAQFDRGFLPMATDPVLESMDAAIREYQQFSRQTKALRRMFERRREIVRSLLPALFNALRIGPAADGADDLGEAADAGPEEGESAGAELTGPDEASPQGTEEEDSPPSSLTGASLIEGEREVQEGADAPALGEETSREAEFVDAVDAGDEDVLVRITSRSRDLKGDARFCGRALPATTPNSVRGVRVVQTREFQDAWQKTVEEFERERLLALVSRLSTEKILGQKIRGTRKGEAILEYHVTERGNPLRLYINWIDKNTLRLIWLGRKSAQKAEIAALRKFRSDQGHGEVVFDVGQLPTGDPSVRAALDTTARRTRLLEIVIGATREGVSF